MEICRQVGFLVFGSGIGVAMAFMIAFAVGFGDWYWSIPCGIVMVLLFVLTNKILEF